MKNTHNKPKHVSNRRFKPRGNARTFTERQAAGQTKEVSVFTINPDVNPKMVDLFQTVSEKFRNCEPALVDVVETIKASPELRKNTKQELLERMHDIFLAANDVVDRIGRIGRVR